MTTKAKKLKMMTRLSGALFSVALSTLGCQHNAKFEKVPYKPLELTEIRNRAFTSAKSLSFFARQGPYSLRRFIDYEIQLSFQNKVLADYFMPRHATDAPLIILQHGNRSFKETHRVQARLLATWGFRVLVPQLPNTGQWHENMRTIKDLTGFIRNRPKVLLGHTKKSKIIGVGHSFGGGVTAMTASRSGYLDGAILLDPALFSAKLIKQLKNIRVPIIILGADENIFHSRRRRKFFTNIPESIVEISIAKAGHWEAQFPSRNQLRWFGIDLSLNEEKQRYFAAALVASAYSLLHNSPLDFAWHLFKKELYNGQLKVAVRK